jgi:hypothetical protein
MASAPVSRIETLIEEKRSLETMSESAGQPTSEPTIEPESPFLVLWEDSGDYTHFLIAWNARPKAASITQVFADEFHRRRGLRAYGVRVSPQRRSKINQITTGVARLEPRRLDLAKPAAA